MLKFTLIFLTIWGKNILMEFILAVLCSFVLLFSYFIYFPILPIFLPFVFFSNCDRRCFDCAIAAFTNITCKNNNACKSSCLHGRCMIFHTGITKIKSLNFHLFSKDIYAHQRAHQQVAQRVWHAPFEDIAIFPIKCGCFQPFSIQHSSF